MIAAGGINRTGGCFMALWRNIGGTSTIAAGATAYWEYSYPPGGRDVGVAIAAPNMLQAQINVELVATEQGVVQRQTRVEEGVPEIHYTVRIRNLGTLALSYNLNIGDWQ
jgi:hypothetical protein